MKNIIIFIFMLVVYEYGFKNNNSVYVSNTSISSNDSYYEELKIKRMSRALVVKVKYSSEVLVTNN